MLQYLILLIREVQDQQQAVCVQQCKSANGEVVREKMDLNLEKCTEQWSGHIHV